MKRDRSRARGFSSTETEAPLTEVSPLSAWLSLLFLAIDGKDPRARARAKAQMTSAFRRVKCRSVEAARTERP